jgi:hypothetical protein
MVKTRRGGRRQIRFEQLRPVKDLFQHNHECVEGGVYLGSCTNFGAIVVEDEKTKYTYLLKSKLFPHQVDMVQHRRMMPVLSALNYLNCEYLMKFYGCFFCQNKDVPYKKGLFRLLLEHKEQLCFTQKETKDKNTLLFYFYEYKCNAETLKQIFQNIDDVVEFKAYFRATIFCILFLLRWLQQTIGFVHHDLNGRNIMMIYYEKPIEVSFPGFKKKLYYVPYIIDFDDSTIHEEPSGIDEHSFFSFLYGSGVYTMEEVEQIKLNFDRLTL